MLGSPNSRQKGQGAMSRVVPKGTSQTFSPRSRSTATSVPQGGGLQGTPNGDTSVSISAAYGVPRCGNSDPKRGSPSLASTSSWGTRVMTLTTWFTFMTIQRREGSKATPPQLTPPATLGNWTLPTSAGGVKMPSERNGGGGATGWVAVSGAPGAPPWGTGRSSTG